MKTRKAVVLAALCLAALAALISADVAAAGTTTTATTGPNVGTNIKTWLSGLGQDVLIPVAGLFGIGALFRRDIGAALLVAIIAIIVGVFVYDPAGASNVINSVAHTLTK